MVASEKRKISKEARRTWPVIPFLLCLTLLVGGCASLQKKGEINWRGEPFSIKKNDSLQMSFDGKCEIHGITMIAEEDGGVSGVTYISCPKDVLNDYEFITRKKK